MANKIRAWHRFTPHQLISAVITIVGIAVVGSILLFQSHAASNVVVGDYDGYANTSGVNSFASETKSPVGIAADYTDGSSWSTIESGAPAGSWTGTPYRLQLGVDMLPNSGSTLAQGATGAYNTYFATLAKNLVSAGQSNAILDIGWEWDGSWSPWYVANTTDATNFATYWQQIVTAMRAVPGANFDYSWYYGDSGSNITTAAYPGSAYVSSIDLDQYDQTWTGSCSLAYNLTAVPTPSSQLVSASTSNCVWNNTILPELNGLASFASAKNEPIGFGEWGVVTRSDGHGLGDDPTFINNFSNWVKANNVIYASYFDYNSGGNSILSNYPLSLAAFQSDFGSSGTATPPVVSPPSTPANVTATATTATSVTISWSASSDTSGPGLGGYYVLRNGTQIAKVTSGTTYTDTSVSGSTSYSYTIEAFDTSNPVKVSAASTAANVTTPAVPLPSAPTKVTATASSATSVSVSWTASTDTGGPGLSGYNVFRGGVKLNSSVISGTSYTDTTAIAGTSYSYTVVAVDKSGNSSVASTAANVTTPTLADTTPPSTPSGVAAKASSSTNVSVSWDASTDSSGGGGIAGYYVLRSTNGTGYTTLGTSKTTSYTDTTVSASNTYNYEIEAFDAAGNVSSASAAASVTTPATTVASPPAAPTGVVASAASPSQINVSWTDASSGVTAYKVFEVGNTTALASLASSVTSYGVTGLNASTAYSFYVVAYDGSVASSNSATVSATTQAAPASQTYATGTIKGLANKCLDNYYSRAVNGNKIDLYSCNGTGAQKWTYNPGNGTITNSNGYCLDVSGNGTTSGTLVDLYKCNGTSAQVWLVKGTQGVAGAIVSPHSGLCLDDKYSGTNNGNQIWIYSCNGTGAQKWTVN